MTAVRAALLISLAASAAQAQHFASDKRFELRLAASLLWYATADIRNSGSDNATAGALPLDLGVGFRPTSNTSVALTGRLGLLQYGGGLEVAWTPEDWSRDGLVVRLSPQLIRDFVSCLSIGTSSPPCDTATYLMLEAGAAYRWAFRSTGGFSIGAALTAGEQRISQSDGTTSRRFAYGLLAPRFSFDF